jgi:hypothetical protein
MSSVSGRWLRSPLRHGPSPCASPGLFPCATTCQVCGLVPTAQAGVQHCAVGVTQLTSPTSVEPARKWDWPSKSRRQRCNGVEHQFVEFVEDLLALGLVGLDIGCLHQLHSLRIVPHQRGVLVLVADAEGLHQGRVEARRDRLRDDLVVAQATTVDLCRVV